jgi:hypothetical protein
MNKIRLCVTKSIILGFLAVAMYLVAFCPCERVGRCHWEGIVLCLIGAGSVLAIENMKLGGEVAAAMSAPSVVPPSVFTQ